MSELLDLGLVSPLLKIPTVFRRETPEGSRVGDAAGDRFTYVFTPELGLAINAALAAQRPLLLRGPAGSGKSSLARAVAGVARRSFLVKVITSDTKLDDLLWSYDHVRRLQDATAQKSEILEDHEYVEPQPLWWALAPKVALGRGVKDRKPVRDVRVPGGDPPVVSTSPVVLLDEIDKADPSLPNDLLVVLGEGKFVVRETGDPVVAEQGREPLVVITTNDERELSRPFVRRCIVVEIPHRSRAELKAWLTQVGEAHFPDDATGASLPIADLAETLVEATPEGAEPPSPAEFVDLLRTCRKLGVGIGHAKLEPLRRLVVSKSQHPGGY